MSEDKIISLRDDFFNDLLGTKTEQPSSLQSATDLIIDGGLTPWYLSDYISGLLVGAGIDQCPTCRIWHVLPDKVNFGEDCRRCETEKKTEDRNDRWMIKK